MTATSPKSGRPGPAAVFDDGVSRLIRDLVDRIDPVAADLGYARKRQTFHRDRDDVRVTAWYQESRRGGAPSFTGTLDATILPIAPTRRLVVQPVRESHWSGRIGELLPQARDTWWEVTDEDLDRVAEEQGRYFRDVVHPALESHGYARYLVGEWRAGRHTHITELQRVRFLEKATAAGY
jgi:hypothetical protein